MTDLAAAECIGYRQPCMGNFLCCQSQAVLNALAQRGHRLPLSSFEIATTLPFGIRHIPGDNFRLIDPILSPTIGVHRALEAFAIPYERQAWEPGTDSATPLKRLRDWLDEGPVVLGSIRMDKLPYLMHGFIYVGIGHYITILEERDSFFIAADPLGFYPARFSPEELVSAWRGDGISESLGEFEMWRITGPPARMISRDFWTSVLKLTVKNFALAEAETLGGASGLEVIAGYAGEESLRFKNAFIFAIKYRLQRVYLAYAFVQSLGACNVPRGRTGWCEATTRLLLEQMNLSAIQLRCMQEDMGLGLAMFKRVANYERLISEAFLELGD